jgi:hypothetical protein
MAIRPIALCTRASSPHRGHACLAIGGAVTSASLVEWESCQFGDVCDVSKLVRVIRVDVGDSGAAVGGRS